MLSSFCVDTCGFISVCMLFNCVCVCVCVVRLAEVSAAVQGALAAPGSVRRVNKLLRELSLQRPDLLTLLQLFRTLAH